MTAYPTLNEAHDAISPEEMEDAIAALPEYHTLKTIATLDLAAFDGAVKPVVLSAWADFAETMAEFGGYLYKSLTIQRLATSEELADAAYEAWRRNEYARRQDNGE